VAKSTHRDVASSVQNAPDEYSALGVSRRRVLTTLAAATAVFSIVDGTPAEAQPLGTKEDMVAFVSLSAALTGIAVARLAPDVDPIGVKQEYFKQASGPKYLAAFATLLQIFKDANLQIPGKDTDGVIKQEDVDKLVARIESNDDTKFLARSIVLMWYLGAWYEPSDLQALTTPNPGTFSKTVVSSKAYTQGWLWRAIQSHPMGYSDMQYGYWTRQPRPRLSFIAIQPKANL
jgi:hypothetical protein